MLTPGDRRLILIRLAGPALIAVVLTLIGEKTFNGVLFILLFPGFVLHLSITGGHGGTLLQEKIAILLEFVVNALAYILVFNAAYLLTRKVLRQRRAIQ